MRAARYLNWRINRRVNAEDTELITRVQLGMQSPSYMAGPLGTSEVCLRSFAQKLRRLIPEARLERPPAQGWSRLAPTHKPVDRQSSREQRQRSTGSIRCRHPRRPRDDRAGEAGAPARSSLPAQS